MKSYETCLLITLAVVVSIFAHSVQVTAQFGSPQLNSVIKDVRKAEHEGARPQELKELVNKLNSEIELEDQLNNLTLQESIRRAQLLTEINSTLMDVDAEAIQLQLTASQRTYVNHMVAYLSGVVGAIAVTIIFHFSLLIREKHRIKRALHSKIVPT